MNPTGAYDRFYNDLLDKYGREENQSYVTFGILIADYNQTDTREYILNYLDHFNRMSEKYFDFFIPGYCDFDFFGGDPIEINNKKYYFNKRMFDEFYEKLYIDFEIRYTYNPMLIIMAMQIANKKTAQYIVIELDDYNNRSVRRAGELFLEIFDVAKKNSDLLNIRYNFVKTYVRGNLIDSIINIAGSNGLKEICRIGNELKRYSIKHG